MTPGGAYPVLLATLRSVVPAAGESARAPAPWEANAHATCDCLSLRGTLDSVARRRAEDELGATIYAEFPVWARPVVVTGHALLELGEISERELEAKIKEVRTRLRKVPTDE
jgi:hypothetical protein